MHGFVANTDFNWFRFLRDHPDLDEVNFWQPRDQRAFRAVPPGAPFFFKLKSPYNAIAGFGFFAHHSVLPAWLAWQTFGSANGAPDFPTMCRAIERLRREKSDRAGAYSIGSIIVTGAVFFPDGDWIFAPRDWSPNIVQGSTYDLTTGEGARIWQECRDRAQAMVCDDRIAAALGAVAVDRYGQPIMVRPRLGQRAFQIVVLDAYGRACAVSTEHSLPVLEAAHIKPYAEGGEHQVANGLCLRADIHKLFDKGYVTVDEDYRFAVSKRLQQDYDNGRVYYALDGHELVLPNAAALRPDQTALAWHRNEKYLG